MAENTNTPAIGISLGTSFLYAGVYRNGEVEIIPNELGHRSTPSYVAFTDQGILVGEAAMDQAESNPTNTVFGVKRLIGMRFDDPITTEDKKVWPFSVVNEEDMLKIQVHFKGKIQTFFPEEIAGMMLKKMKENAEAYLGTKITDAVLTVPASFNDSQRQATKDAGTIAGLNVIGLLNEPTAAAIAYGRKEKVVDTRRVMICDVGGGTVDASLVTIEDGMFDVESTDGYSHMGGTDFTNRMKDYFVGEIKRAYNKDISNDKVAVERLRNACEHAKKILSSEFEASVEIKFDGTDFIGSITRNCFEWINGEYLVPMEQVMDPFRESKLRHDAIHDVVLVGGSTRIPFIQKMLDVIFHGKELKKFTNPDEVVAYGAAVEAAILNGARDTEIENIFICDICPRSVALETADKVAETFVRRCTIIPCKRSIVFTTHSDNQSAILIRISEGEKELFESNHLLGEFEVTGIAPAPRSVPKIEVTLEIDRDGILSITAREEDKELTVKVDKGRLKEEDIKRLANEITAY